MKFLHIGDHSSIPSVETLWHLLAPAHLVFILLASLVAVVALAKRWATSPRVKIKHKDTPNDPR